MNHLTLLIMLPMLVALAALMYTIARHLGRAWLDYRVKLAILEKLETQPEALETVPVLQDLVENPETSPEEGPRLDLILTGIFLVLIGLGSSLLAHLFLGGRYATGVYFGGVACVPIGFLLVLSGVLLKLLNRRMRVQA